MDCSSKLESFCFSHLEDELHSTFAKSRHCDTSVYVENEELFQTLDAHCEQSISGDGCASPIVIAGEPGSGKSAFLSNWTDRRRSSAPPTRSLEYDEFVFWHAIGCSRLSTQVSHLLRRLVNSLTKHFELKEVMDLADDKLPWVLPRILERAAKKGRVVIVIDGGLQHICSKDEDLGLRWLPLRLPPNVRMIISVMLPTVHGNLSRNSDYATMLHAKTQHTWDEIQRRRWPIVLIERMDSGNVTSVIEKFHTMGTKEISLSEKRNLKECISLHPMAGNPFFLTYILRAIYHANELKYDMQQCLRRWASSEVKSSSYLIEQILATFESGFVKNETLGSEMGRNGAYILGPMLGHSLSLLFVARHGLHENELFELLGYVQEKSKWIDKTSGTVVPVKLKIVKMLMQKKKRLIDVFRSFDTDGNGTLSHEEFYKGMQKLDINASHEEVTMLINEVDNNGDGEIDYQETLDHFEHISRSYLHGKRRSSVFKPVTTVDLVSREASSLTDTYKENLMQTLRCIGIVCLDTGKGCTLSLPFENTVLRDTVWRRYVKPQHGEAQSRSFLIEYFTTHQASLRRCEELPWHLKKCRSWSLLKKVIVDLRTLDIMYNHEELRSELFHIMHKLTEGKSSSQNTDANPQSPDGTKEKISKTQKQMVKFDIVHEYNRSMEHWYLKHNPSSTQVAMMCDFIADVMSWFSKKISRLTKIPPFMRENIDCVHLQKIGFGCKEHYEHMMRGVFEDRPWTCTSVGTRGRNKIEHDKDHETFYFLNRWIWIQFPWLALKTASKIYDQPHELPDNSSRPSSSHNNPRPVCFDGKKDRRFWNVKKKDTDSSIIIDSNNLSPRSKAMTHAGVAVPSAALLKVGKIKSKETRKKVPAIIPFSTKRKTRTRLEDKSSCFSAVGVADETSPQDDDSGSPQISTKYSVFAQTQEDATLNLAFSRLSEMRDIYDNIVVERAGKAKYLKELEKSVAERSIGDEKGHKSIVAGEAILEKLQNRLDKINDLIGKASGVDNIYKEILIALQSCNPSDQKRHLELEQQIVLSKQQISDLNGREDILDREIDRALSASAEVSSAIKSTMLERQRLKPLLESLRIRTNEGIERRKALRVASYETMAFSRKNKLDSVLSVMSRRKTKRNDKMMRSQSLLAQPHAEDVIATITTLHPMEMLAHAAGTHDPFAIIEKMKQSESREDELRKRQDKNEILMKDRVLRLRSLQDKIQDLRLADGDSKTNRTTAAIDRQIANTESKLLSRQKELSSLTNLIQDIFLAVRNLHVMVQSIDHIQVCNAAISEVIQCTSDETNESRDDEGLSILPIKTLCDEILIGNNTPYSPCGMSRTGKLKSGWKEPYNLNNKKTATQMDQKNTKKRCPNMRIFNKEEQESRYVEFTKQLHDLNDENICNNDCSTDANQDDDEDFEKLSMYVRQSIKTNASENEQRRANLLSNAKQGRYANKGLILEAVMQSVSVKGSLN